MSYEKFAEADQGHVFKVLDDIFYLVYEAITEFEEHGQIAENWYTASLGQKITEADARAILAEAMSNREAFVNVHEGVRYKLVPKPIQRKMDGSRGAQMNFWLWLNNAYTRFNLHVGVIPLEKSIEQAMMLPDEDGFTPSPKGISGKASTVATALRRQRSWAPPAKKT